MDALDTMGGTGRRRLLLEGMQLHEKTPPQQGLPPAALDLGVELPPLHDDRIEDAIRAAIRWHARSVILPQVTAAAMLQHLDVLLTVIEAEENQPGAPLRIAACPADTAEGAFFARDFRRMSGRLEALIWDGPAFCRATGITARDAKGEEPETLRTARSLFLLSAKAAGLFAIDTAPATEEGASGDPEAFAAECQFVRQLGFDARIAMLAFQAPIIEAAFTVPG